jgi:hypothetical protein
MAQAGRIPQSGVQPPPLVDASSGPPEGGPQRGGRAACHLLELRQAQGRTPPPPGRSAIRPARPVAVEVAQARTAEPTRSKTRNPSRTLPGPHLTPVLQGRGLIPRAPGREAAPGHSRRRGGAPPRARGQVPVHRLAPVDGPCGVRTSPPAPPPCLKDPGKPEGRGLVPPDRRERGREQRGRLRPTAPGRSWGLPRVPSDRRSVGRSLQGRRVARNPPEAACMGLAHPSPGRSPWASRWRCGGFPL